MITVGLTGGIGSGKSTVSAAFAARGAALIDADAIVRALQEPGQAVFAAMVERFGRDVVTEDGRLDRAAVAAVVFTDDAARKDLERIVHPATRERIAARLQEEAESDGVVVLDIPLLAEGRRQESGGRKGYPMSGVLVVDCPPEIAVERLVAQRGFDRADAEARIKNQVSRDERLALADHVVDNSGEREALEDEIEAAWKWASALTPVDPQELP